MNAVGGTAAPFHDKEALQQQIRRLRKEKTALQADQVELEGRIEQASANLIELKKRQVQLKTAKEVAEEQSKGKAASGLPKSEFSVQERLLELSLLNGELEKSQSALESEAKRCQELAKQAQDALASSQRKYDAMPMRFKQTLAEAQVVMPVRGKSAAKGILPRLNRIWKHFGRSWRRSQKSLRRRQTLGMLGATVCK
ncbi:unnamed protein product [Chrysoparadoxa australica]